MKRRKLFLRAFSASMAVMMTMGFAACTGKTSGESESGKDVKVSGDIAELASNLFKENKFDLSSLYEDGVQVEMKSVKKIGDKFYFVAEKSTDSIVKKIAVLELDPNSGEQKLKEIEATDSDDSAVEFAGATMGDDGKVYAIKRTIADQEQIKSQVLCRWNVDGSLIDETDLSSDEKNNDLTIHTIVPLENKTLLIAFTLDEYQAVWSKIEDGKLADFQKLDETLFGGSFFLNTKGQVCCVGYDGNYSHVGVKVFNDKMEVEEMKNLPESLRYDGIFEGISFIEEDTVVFSGDGSLYTYHFGDKEAKEIVNYVNSNLDMERLQSVFFKENGDFFATYMNVADQKINFGEFVKADPSEIVSKELIRIGGFQYAGNEDALKKKIVEFNAKNENYKLVYEDYSKYSEDGDFMGGLTKMNNDIISGNAPDIFIANGLDNFEGLAAKGVLADIGELMENDPEISKLEYMENVFDAYKVNGKLYKLIPNFAVNTMVAKKSLIGDRTTFTIQDMKEILEKMGEGAKPFYGVDNENFVRSALVYNLNELVDLDSGECSFDSQEFIDILEYANTLPKAQQEKDIVVFDDETMNDFAGQYRNNKTLLYDMGILSFNDIKLELNGYMGEQVSYVGFPSANGNGACIFDTESYAISEKSKYKDVAWSFLRELLMEDYQNNIRNGLPVLKSAFKEKSRDALSDKMKYIDENGVEQEYEDDLIINGEKVKVQGLTEEQLAELVNYIESIKVAQQTDSALFDIVMEEVAPFFDGKKSAKEVAQIIQNRASLWVKEQQ